MKKTALVLVMTSLVAVGQVYASADRGSERKTTAHIIPPTKGIDYPTDLPLPPDLENKMILVVQPPTDNISIAIQGHRIIVDKSAVLRDLPGYDKEESLSFLTDPDRNSSVYFPIQLEKAVAGVDFPLIERPTVPDPSDPEPEPDFFVWSFEDSHRLPLDRIYAIEKASNGDGYEFVLDKANGPRVHKSGCILEKSTTGECPPRVPLD